MQIGHIWLSSDVAVHLLQMCCWLATSCAKSLQFKAFFVHQLDNRDEMKSALINPCCA